MKDAEAELVARRFHEHYERLAPEFGWETQMESRVDWVDVPDRNRELMKATVAAVFEEIVGGALDEAIRHWRSVPEGTDGMVSLDHAAAALYVDAFQSARVSLLGEVLP